MTAFEQSAILIITMIKRILNRSRDYLVALPTIERRWVDRLKGKVSCLLYHRVEAYGDFDFLDRGGSPVISEPDFDRELSYLKQLPVKFYTLSDLSNGKFPDSDTIGIVICFDDGFKCNYIQGLRLLDQHGITAVIFQCTGYINAPSLNWEHLLYWLDQNPATRQALVARLSSLSVPKQPANMPMAFFRETMDSSMIEALTRGLVDEFGLGAQIADMAKRLYPDRKMIVNAMNQGIEIASHGHHHYKRDTVSEEKFMTDLRQSKTELSSISGQQEWAYSYPFNSFLTGDHDLVKRHFRLIAYVAPDRIDRPLTEYSGIIPRLNWPGPSTNQYRMKRWLLTGSF